MRHAATMATLILAAALTGCSGEKPAVQALEPDRSSICALDGMLLLDYPGPKGQILYKDGEREFYCDTIELLSIYLRPEQQRGIRAIFTQDMGSTDWKEPRDHWIDATKAFYVRGSDLHGSMGPTFATFARREDANSFIEKHGGELLRFDQITVEMVDLRGGAKHDDSM
ncbi:MAG TPA: nitrous oxide reductase accessory protein NosL [Gammaproteobacteria bacterium]|nr:nitrous oxide reductase accessory protein NosL [Gammaproteobacteria bacterium]